MGAALRSVKRGTPVTSKFRTIVALACLALAATARSTETYTEVSQSLVLPPPARGDGEAGDRFGWSIARSGNLVAISAPEDVVGVTRLGSVYLFDLASPGRYIQKIVSPVPRGWFGTSLAFQDDVLVVGHPPGAHVYVLGEDGRLALTQSIDNERSRPVFGAAIVAALPDIGIAHQKGIDLYRRAPNDQFEFVKGFSADSVGAYRGGIAMTADNVYIGVPRTIEFQPMVAHHRRLSSSWIQMPLHEPAFPVMDGFGQSLAADGPWLIVTNPQRLNEMETGGTVYSWHGEPRSLIERVMPIAGGNVEGFGLDVNVSAERLAVVANGGQELHVYQRSLDRWVPSGRVTGAPLRAGTELSGGRHLADDRLIVSTSHPFSKWSEAHVIEGDVSRPDSVTRLSAGIGHHLRAFGTAFAAGGNVVAIVSNPPVAPDWEARAGEVHVYRRSAARLNPVATIRLDRDAPPMLAADGDLLAVAIAREDVACNCAYPEVDVYRVGPGGLTLSARFRAPPSDFVGGYRKIALRDGRLALVRSDHIQLVELEGDSWVLKEGFPDRLLGPIAFGDRDVFAVQQQGRCNLRARRDLQWEAIRAVVPSPGYLCTPKWSGTDFIEIYESGVLRWREPTDDYSTQHSIAIEGTFVGADAGGVHFQSGLQIRTYRREGSFWSLVATYAAAPNRVSGVASLGELLLIGYPDATGPGDEGNYAEGRVDVFDRGRLFGNGFE
jgi:hypothetical protein